MADAAKPAASLLDRAETMLFGFASGALTGAACLAVLKRQFGRRAPRKADGDDDTQDTGECVKGAGTAGPDGLSGPSGCTVVASPYGQGPLQHASDLFNQIRTARLAASASVAEFKHLVSLQQLKAYDPNITPLQQQLGALEVQLSRAGEGLFAGEADAPELDTLQVPSGDDACSSPECADAPTQQQTVAPPPHPANQAGTPGPLDQHHAQQQQQECNGADTPQSQQQQQQQLEASEAAVDAGQSSLLEAQAEPAAGHLQVPLVQSATASGTDTADSVQQCWDSLETQVMAAEQHSEALQGQMHQLLQALAQHEELLQAAQQQVELKDSQLQAAQSQLDMKQVQLQQATQLSEQLQQQLAAALQQVEAAQQQQQAAAQGVAAARQQLQLFLMSQQHLLGDLAHLGDWGDSTAAHSSTILAQLQHHLRQQQQQQEECVQTAQQQQQVKVAAIRAELLDTQEDVMMLQQQLAVLQQQLHNMQAAGAAAHQLQQVLQEAAAAAEACLRPVLGPPAGRVSDSSAAAEHSSGQQWQTEQQQTAQPEAPRALTATSINQATCSLDGAEDLQLLQAAAWEVQQQAELRDLAAAWPAVNPAHQEQEAVLPPGEHPHKQQQQQQQGQESSWDMLQTQQPVRHEEAAVEAGQADAEVLEAQQTLLHHHIHDGESNADTQQNTSSSQTGVHAIGSACGGGTGATELASTNRQAGRCSVLPDRELTTVLPNNTMASCLAGDATHLSVLGPHEDNDTSADSLLNELKLESDELAQQLTQLQQYLKTSTAKYGDINSIEAMDEGLQMLRRLTDNVVVVAASTVERVSSGGAPRSAPCSTAGRPPSQTGEPHQRAVGKHATCAGTLDFASEAQTLHAVQEAAGVAASRKSVAMRRLGLELPRLQSWGSEVTAVEPVGPMNHLLAAAAAASMVAPVEDEEPRSDGTAADRSAGTTGAVTTSTTGADALVSGPAAGMTLDHWGSLPDTACTWLAGDLHIDEELEASFPGTPTGSTTTASAAGTTAAASAAAAAAAAARVPSRLAAVSIAAAGEASSLSAWGSGMLPFSGAGSVVLDQQQQQQQQQHVHQAPEDSGPGQQQLRSLPDIPSSASSLQQQLHSALAEVRALQGERVALQSRLHSLSEYAAAQEDSLAVNSKLLEVLTTGLLDNRLLTDGLSPSTIAAELAQELQEQQALASD